MLQWLNDILWRDKAIYMLAKLSTPRYAEMMECFTKCGLSPLKLVETSSAETREIIAQQFAPGHSQDNSHSLYFASQLLMCIRDKIALEAFTERGQSLVALSRAAEHLRRVNEKYTAKTKWTVSELEQYLASIKKEELAVEKYAQEAKVFKIGESEEVRQKAIRNLMPWADEDARQRLGVSAYKKGKKFIFADEIFDNPSTLDPLIKDFSVLARKFSGYDEVASIVDEQHIDDCAKGFAMMHEALKLIQKRAVALRQKFQMSEVSQSGAGRGAC